MKTHNDRLFFSYLCQSCTVKERVRGRGAFGHLCSVQRAAVMCKGLRKGGDGVDLCQGTGPVMQHKN